jgi:uncharacterized membrane protein
MESRVKLLGHPIHPMLVTFPLALFSTALLFDLVYQLTANDELTTFSFWAIAAGVVGGLAAAVFGLIDWLGIPSDTRAKRIGLVHGVGNVVITTMFAVAWLIRMGDPAYEPGVVPIVLELAGAGLALFTAWLGGELVYRLRVAVDDGANLDASSSLSGGRAAEAAPQRRP